MKKNQVGFLHRLIRGAIGKKYVIKHYRYGVIMTRFPDMTRIIASGKQRKCRNLFREAVAFAMSVMADPVQKEAYKKKLKVRYRLFNRLIKEYMTAAPKHRQQRLAEGAIMTRKCFSKSYAGTNSQQQCSSSFLRRATVLPVMTAGSARNADLIQAIHRYIDRIDRSGYTLKIHPPGVVQRMPGLKLAPV